MEEVKVELRMEDLVEVLLMSVVVERLYQIVLLLLEEEEVLENIFII